MNEVSGIKTKGAALRVSDDARTLFACMLLAGKNVSLYPDGHSISSKSIHQFHNRLEVFIRQHGDFKIEIEKDRVTSQGEEIYTGPFEEGTLPFTLFRDGIKWLELSAGVTENEIRDLLAFLNSYRILSAEPDGDIVTALWEKRFSHIQYEATDILFGDETESIKGISQFNTGMTGVDVQPQNGFAAAEVNMIDPDDLVLSPEEEASLQSMILLEETADASAHLFMLLDSLLLYEDQESFGTVLDVLADEFKNFLESRDFQACLIILEGVRHIMDSGRLDSPWAGPLMETFFMTISDIEYLKPLEEIWCTMQVREVDILARILLRLHPVAANQVALLLIMSKPPQLQTIVEDSLISYVSREGDCLDPVIASADEKMATRLIPVLLKVDADVAEKYLMQLVRHPSVAVRRLAVRALARGRKFPVAEIFGLIDDPDEDVRRLMIRQLSRERDSVAEYLLLRYLESHKFSADQNAHVLECFKALGRCGSLRSVPYLSKTLFSRKWISSFNKSPFQQGAALALAALKIPESDQVLESARHSIHLGLRRVVREACGADAGKRREGR